MNCKIFAALVVVACAVAVQGRTDFQKKPSKLNSADVEALLDPTVQSLPGGQHKLVYKGASGQEQCVVCQPFQGCGCRDVVAIRCELKRLKQKLLRLKRIAAPHQRSHHGREEPEKVKKTRTLPYVKPAVLPVVQPKILIAPKPAVDPVVKPAVQPAPEPKKEEPKIRPLIKKAVKPLVKPQVKLANLPYVKPAVEPTVKLAVEPAVVKPAVLVDPKPEVKPAVQPAVLVAPKPLVKVAVVKPAVEEKKVVLV